MDLRVPLLLAAVAATVTAGCTTDDVTWVAGEAAYECPQGDDHAHGNHSHDGQYARSRGHATHAGPSQAHDDHCEAP